MPLLSFQDQFVEPIQQDRKTHTIRAERKVPIKPGDTLYLYARARRKDMYRIIEPVTCTRVQVIEIEAPLPDCAWATIRVDGITLWHDEREQLAVRDGFSSHEAMLAFWLKHNELPFHGQIIHWRRFPVAEGQA